MSHNRGGGSRRAREGVDAWARGLHHVACVTETLGATPAHTPHLIVGLSAPTDLAILAAHARPVHRVVRCTHHQTQEHGNHMDAGALLGEAVTSLLLCRFGYGRSPYDGP